MALAITRESFGLYRPFLPWLAAGEHDLSCEDASAFHTKLKASRLELAAFDWKDWYERTHLVDKPAYLETASVHDCRVIISAMLRLERFSPGVMENLRRQGVLCALMARLDELWQLSIDN
ncbi:DUF6508 domain-containing protein [Shewanella sp.]|uniref:DUF6508 domain-containing protein n=1 Tax=Shewanella sp. TaxID=50422 RepID=UPI0035619C09